MSPMRFVLMVVATFSLFLATASAASAADGRANGVVTLRGKPIIGKITFHLDDQFVGAKVNQEGRFKVNRVPVGVYKVTIEGKDIPANFASEDVTPLTVKVKEGDNMLDFSLE